MRAVVVWAPKTKGEETDMVPWVFEIRDNADNREFYEAYWKTGSEHVGMRWLAEEQARHTIRVNELESTTC